MPASPPALAGRGAFLVDMPVPPDDLKQRYERIGLRVYPGIKQKFKDLAELAEKSPPELFEHWVETAFKKSTGAPK